MPARTVGEALRDWRQRRRMSQLDLALEAEISQRHLSFLESGRSLPSREMLLHLAERLEVPLRERNPMLLAAGYAPVYAERRLDDPAMKPAREAIELVLRGHEPFPALAVDRHWTLVSANAALGPLLAEVRDAALLRPPVNVLRLALHPAGLAPAIANLPEWRAHLLDRLRHQIAVGGDTVLSDLMRELAAYPVPALPVPRPAVPARDYAGVVVPLELVTRAGPLSFFSTTTVFGTPVDVTLSELALESFFPADAATAERLRALAAPAKAPGLSS
ncbi:helix-turn-helix domain-containing protein [Labrys wisconsinensis]|uniref:Transcriptional regulator with XRE-family HTH domain n=1 Tax=Labrys wisconsinensis TaxID=425677 RepID=A0ABU0JGS5_9HYPH|nr:helix-turn-helix transcriptional regulator [Labrys wisconsinensis]MDQ0473483.1 transcriptional regulator with XRE-family HTH domain [Labrys wisconsinensis]